MSFKGYRRQDGQVGTRNYIGVISTVACANDIAWRISEAVPGSAPFIHGQGCSQTKPDLEFANKTLISLDRHWTHSKRVHYGLVSAYDGLLRSLEDPMVALKALSVLVAGLLSLIAVGFMVREMQAVKVKARTRQNTQPRTRRLRQDPRTGIYYPEG